MFHFAFAFQFPNRKRRNKCGEKDQYLAEQLHPEIISKEIFDAVQSERQRRSNVVIDENGEKKRAGKRYCSKIMSETDIEPFDGTLEHTSIVNDKYTKKKCRNTPI